MVYSKSQNDQTSTISFNLNFGHELLILNPGGVVAEVGSASTGYPAWIRTKNNASKVRCFYYAKVFRVGECQKSLDRGAKKVGIDRITHHDLRHLFATRCIESGVDIPTVSRWLGHKDGALAMKTYGHLRREHSIAQAAKVSFAPVVTKHGDVIPFPATA